MLTILKVFGIGLCSCSFVQGRKRPRFCMTIITQGAPPAYWQARRTVQIFDGAAARARFARPGARIGRRREMKTVTFSIRPLSEVVDDFAETFYVVRTGRPIPKKPRDEVGFTSIEAARNFLTRERLAQAHDSNAPSRLAL
jgi:hypothetical protein